MAALPDTDVINAGVLGVLHRAGDAFYEREGRKYRPDPVILVVVPNDPTDNLTRAARASSRRRAVSW
jgi:hypothetical protein